MYYRIIGYVVIENNLIHVIVSYCNYFAQSLSLAHWGQFNSPWTVRRNLSDKLKYKKNMLESDSLPDTVEVV